MSVFLTPDLKPIMGGTYFPPKDSVGRPGFATLLKTISNHVRLFYCDCFVLYYWFVCFYKNV